MELFPEIKKRVEARKKKAEKEARKEDSRFMTELEKITPHVILDEVKKEEFYKAINSIKDLEIYCPRCRS